MKVGNELCVTVKKLATMRWDNLGRDGTFLFSQYSFDTALEIRFRSTHTMTGSSGRVSLTMMQYSLLHCRTAMSLDDQRKPLSEYREFIAPALLSTSFLCFWNQTIIGSQGVYEHRVLPDGCIDIVFINDEPPIVVGPWTVSFVARLAARTRITGARLHPGRASCLLGIPASELLNQSIAIADLKGAVQNMPFEKVIQQSSTAARRRALAEVLLASVERSALFDRAVLSGI